MTNSSLRFRIDGFTGLGISMQAGTVYVFS